MLARACLISCLCCFALGVAPALARAQDADFGARKLELQLRDARAERDATTRLWPRLVVAVGATSMLVGTVVGVSEALSCDRACDAPPWIGAAVVAGAAVAVAGTVWWIRVDRDLRELDLRVKRLEDDLEHARPQQAQRAALLAPRPWLTLRFRL
jgi:hypothetical protein